MTLLGHSQTATKPMPKRIYRTLSRPRFQTGAAVTAYIIILILGAELIPVLIRDYTWIYWVPGIFMITGALVGLPAAWRGGEKAARAELVSLPITIAGLLGGVVIEANDLRTDFASHVLFALGLIVLISVIVRWQWLRDHYDL